MKTIFILLLIPTFANAQKWTSSKIIVDTFPHERATWMISNNTLGASLKEYADTTDGKRWWLWQSGDTDYIAVKFADRFVVNDTAKALKTMADLLEVCMKSMTQAVKSRESLDDEYRAALKILRLLKNGKVTDMKKYNRYVIEFNKLANKEY